ncbi:MAG: hypothetical protein HFE90_02250 [Firmicutes bacterium]|nr:hypothetical protein [Bacillota bacterium]
MGLDIDLNVQYLDVKVRTSFVRQIFSGLVTVKIMIYNDKNKLMKCVKRYQEFGERGGF